MATVIEIDARDPDIKGSSVTWYETPAECVFLKQIESDGRSAGTLLFSREAIPDLIAALQKAHGHDSDCAQNNAPALPVGPCDCTLSAYDGGPK